MKLVGSGTFNWRSSIFWKTYFFNLILLFTTLAICFFSARTILPSVALERSQMITDATVNRLADQASWITNELQQLQELIKENPTFSTNDPKLLMGELKNIINYSPLIDNAAVFNKQGELISMFPDGNDLKNVSFRSYFSTPLLTGNAYLSDIILTKSGSPVLVLGIPIQNPQHQVENIVALRIELMENRMVQSLFEHFDIGNYGYPFIVDRNGRLLFHPKKERIAEDVHQNEAVAALMKGESGQKILTNLEGVEMISSYRYIPYLQWGVVAQVPVQSTYSSLNALEQMIEKYIFIFLIPLMFVIALYTQRIIQPVKKLQRAVHEVMDGNYNYHIPTNTKNEIGLLFHCFNKMVTQIRENDQHIKENQQELLEQKLFLRQILDLDPNYIHARNREGKYTLVNQAKLNFFGFSKQEEMIGKNEIELNPDQQVAIMCLEQDQKAFENEKGFFIPEYPLRDKQGNTHWIQVHKIPLKNYKNQVEYVLSIATDITERKQKEDEIQHIAFHDSLTGLPNRFALEKHVTRAIEQTPVNQTLALMFLDLDHFKLINDSLGHVYGDRLIEMVANRLKSCLPENGCVARMGGDEFIILLTDLQEEVTAEKVAQTILSALAPTFQIEEMEFHVTTSIGISFYPKDGEVYEALLKKADTAMYQAKKTGKNRYHIFDPVMERSLWERLEMEASLRKALEHEELFLVYQPKFDLGTDRVNGMEALVRWQHPIYGEILPDKFIPIIEENGLIIPIGEWIIQEACRQNKSWQEQGYKSLKVAVNLSVKQLLHPHFLSMIDRVLQDTGLAPEWLELEITESTIMENAAGVVSILKAVKEKGIALSIDDFGTGYSSLSYLRQFPIHTIKVDRSFIRDFPLTEESQMIIRAILSMAKSLKLKVIAEGVEEQQQIDFLRREGCNEIQGYIISRPLTSNGFTEFLLKDSIILQDV